MSAVTTRLLDRLDPPGTTGPADDPYQHLWCCDENVALCGLDLTGYEDDPDSDEPVCALCAIAYAEGMPCPVPGCEEGDGDA